MFLRTRPGIPSSPAGKHDDQVDALGLIGQLLDTIMHGQPLSKPQLAKPAQEYVPYRFGRADNDWMTI